MSKECYRCIQCNEITIYKKNTEDIILKGCDCGNYYLIPATNKR